MTSFQACEGRVRFRRTTPFASLLAVACLALAILPASQAHARVKPFDQFITGNPEDVQVTVTQRLLLMGGGPEVDVAVRRWLAGVAGGDVLVLRASGSDGYNDYLFDLGDVDSVETLVLHRSSASFDEEVLASIAGAEAILLAGGDQSDYLAQWAGTPLSDALGQRLLAGAALAGTSAGLAVMGEFAFSAENGSVGSDEALADPFNRRITLTPGLVSLDALRGVITDSHFYERDRMGRLVTFVARLWHDGVVSASGAPLAGLGLDEETALVLDPDGQASVFGLGHVYLVTLGRAPLRVEPNRALLALGVEVRRVRVGDQLDWRTWSGAGVEYRVHAVGGRLWGGGLSVY